MGAVQSRTDLGSGKAVVGPLAGLGCLLVLLGTIDAVAGLGLPGWAVGSGCGVGASGALIRGLARREPGAHHARKGLGPADRVTLGRAVLACAVAALAAESFTGHTPVTLLVSLSAVALACDALDGRVARRTRTSSAFGARFDMEVDAFLILVLSVYVAPTVGWWVLAIGAARYAFVAAGRVWPWLRGSAPPRPWCKVVAATQGVALTVVATGLLPVGLSRAVLAVALALLAESFGRETWQLYGLRPFRAAPDRRTPSARSPEAAPTTRPRRRVGLRAAASVAATVLACLAVWSALVLPDRMSRLAPGALVRIPLEGLAVVTLALVLRRRVMRVVAVVFGGLLGLLVVVKVLDMGFFTVFERPFDLVNDWAYLGPAVGVLGDSVGRGWAIAVVAATVLLVVALLTVLPICVLRLTRVVARHRPTSGRVVASLGIAWVLCALAGLQLAPNTQVASASGATTAFDEVSRLRADIADRETFAKAIAVDRFRDVPGDQVLTGLRGKDVLLVFVESYGRVAVQDPVLSPQVDATLDAGTRRLRAAGFSSRSAYLTSPTFGAASWLAHSTLQSGLWVSSQQRYDQLLSTDRMTLTGAFARAGWRTVFDVPAITHAWPDGTRFYGFDKLYDAGNTGYRGPRFGYATMPDQYTLAAFRRRELMGPHRAPVMAELDLVSSHHPWTPLPHLVGWSRVGDGSVFDAMPERGESAEVAFRDPDEVRALYAQSLVYTLRTLVSFVTSHPDPNLVLVVLGDHQPHTYVTGPGAGHDVPITVIAHDPEVTDRISGWAWQQGMNPGPDAPVWRMDHFRDEFLSTFSSSPSEPGTRRFRVTE